MENILKLIEGNEHCVLATSSNDNPRASIMEYVIIDGNILLSTTEDSIKGQNLKKNKKVSISIMKLPEYITIDGVMEELSEELKEKYYNIIAKKHPELIEMEKSGKLGKFLCYKLTDMTAYYSNMAEGLNPPLIAKL